MNGNCEKLCGTYPVKIAVACGVGSLGLPLPFKKLLQFAVAVSVKFRRSQSVESVVSW